MALLNDTIESPRELFVHKLGAALTMEQTILEMLDELEAEADDPRLRRDLPQHHKETEGQVENLSRVFAALGELAEKSAVSDDRGAERRGRNDAEGGR